MSSAMNGSRGFQILSTNALHEATKGVEKYLQLSLGSGCFVRITLSAFHLNYLSGSIAK